MSNKNKNKTGVVYSTDPDFTYQYDTTEEPETLPPHQQALIISLHTHQRAGKVVTAIDRFVGKKADMEQLAKMLRNHCGTGGSVKNGLILLQGDCREKASQWLKKAGYRHEVC